MHHTSAVKLAIALLLGCWSTVAGAQAWNVTGAVQQQGLSLRVTVAVTDHDGHPVTGLAARNFQVDYGLDPMSIPGVHKGQVDPASLQSFRHGGYTFLFRTADPNHPPTIVKTAVVTLTKLPQRGVTRGQPVTFEQKASVVLTSP